jgi:acetylornithine deacetylase/succinyl-diaminopimelate desuccinylase-like protein
MSDLEKLLCELIALPSVNPAFLPAGDPHAGEGRVADFLAATAARAGLEVHFQQVALGPFAGRNGTNGMDGTNGGKSATPNPQSAIRNPQSAIRNPQSEARSNLLATLRPAGPGRLRVLLAPHLDTVPAASEEQYTPRLDGPRIYGRGACDTKGSVAAMLAALCQLAKHGPLPAETEIVFAGLADEEDLQRGSRSLAAGGFKADLAIVGEPTRLRIVTAHKGSLWLGLATRGKSAHGSRPGLGRNAVLEMARVVCLLETEYARRLRRRRHPLLGCATVNVGVIAGGTQPNIVPASCQIGVDRRTLPGETESSVRAELRALFQERHLRVKIDNQKQAACWPMETDSRLPLVRQFLRVAGQKKAAGVDYFCDASVLARAGTASVVFGPGDIAQAHTAEEWIARKSLETAAALLLKFLRSLP